MTWTDSKVEEYKAICKSATLKSLKDKLVSGKTISEILKMRPEGRKGMVGVMTVAGIRKRANSDHWQGRVLEFPSWATDDGSTKPHEVLAFGKTLDSNRTPQDRKKQWIQYFPLVGHSGHDEKRRGGDEQGIIMF